MFPCSDPADMNQKRALLEVREDGRGNTYVPNLLCVKVKSYKSVYQLVAKGGWCGCDAVGLARCVTPPGCLDVCPGLSV